MEHKPIPETQSSMDGLVCNGGQSLLILPGINNEMHYWPSMHPQNAIFYPGFSF